MKNLLDTKFLKVYNNDGWCYASRKNDPVASGNMRPDAVIIWGVFGKMSRRTPVIRQYRKSIGQYIWELPAGLIDAGESPQQAADRELYEETGLHITNIVSVVPMSFPSVGLSDEIHAIVKCEVDGDLDFTAGKWGTGQEDIQLDLWRYEDFKKHISEGELIDGRLAMIYLGMFQ